MKKTVTKDYNFHVLFPVLSKEWHPDNLISPDKIRPYNIVQFKWICSSGHVWNATPYSRVKGNKCNICANNIPSENYNFFSKHPLDMKYWDYEKNSVDPKRILPFSRDLIHLKCEFGHSWTIHAYTKDMKGCPFCLNKRLCNDNSFLVTHPKLLENWDYEKNTVKPDEIFPSSQDNIWWKCKLGHEWNRTICHVTERGNNCPYCSHELPSKEYNSLLLFPDLIKDWCTDNKYRLEYITPSSSKVIKWKCHICNNVWHARIAERTYKEAGCPACRKVKLSDGAVLDSRIEAYYYLMLKESGVEFYINKRYPDIKLRYDFYIPIYNLYIEVTSYNGKEKWWNHYINKINFKKNYVENNLKCGFEFINRQMTSEEVRFVRENLY